MVTTFCVGGVILLVFLWFIITFNTFVRSKNMMHEAWSGVDVQLKRRHDLIPNLVQAVKGYAAHERGLFEKVSALRSQCMASGSLPERITAETNLGAGLTRLLALVENYPELKADRGFTELQKSLIDVEDHIELTRRYYNGTVRNFNILAESFPSLLVAKVMKLESAQFFEIETNDERFVPSAAIA
jgi:LemA protein